MSKAIKLRMVFWRWHRRVGIASALVLVLLCITGLFLNHSTLLKLDKSSVHSPLMLSLYGIEVPDFLGIPLQQGNWVAAVGQRLYFNENYLHDCEGQFVGALAIPDSPIWLAACEQEFLIFTKDNILVEVVGEAFGLTPPVQSLGLCNEQVCFTANQKLYRADLDTLEWLPLRNTEYRALNLQKVPASLQATYRHEFVGGDLTWERVIQDLHAARFFGEAGPWLLDMFVLCFLFLSFSGFYLWLKQGRRLKK